MARLVVAIENLRPDGGWPRCQEIDGELQDIDEEGIGEWFALNGYLPDGRLRYCLQTVCLDAGLYFVEAIINYYEGKVTHDNSKAGRKEPCGAVVHSSGRGCLKTYENEQLSTLEVILIAQHFFEKETLHPDFQ
jgi:hypothetical protein